MVEKLPPGSFFGRSSGEHRVSGITILESLYHDEFAVPPHEHSSAFFDFVVGGGCTEVIRGESRTRNPWTLAFHPAGEVHASCWHGVGSRCFHIEIPDVLLDRLREGSPEVLDPAVFHGGAPVWLARRLHDEFQRMDQFSAMAIEGLTLELLVECARHEPHRVDRTPPPWLDAVLEILHQNAEAPLSLGSIALQVGVHPAHLARVFREFHGSSLGAFARALRIDLATRLLTGSEHSLAQIALIAGFADQSHFSRVFKRQTGLSPGVFRRSACSRNSRSNQRSNRDRS
jgi:AraC family transcriptional regulator